MPSALPSGEPAPADGALPDEALAELGSRPFGFYVHVPFCTVRCGYCDFNTYTAEDLGRSADMRGASRSTYAEAAIDEVRLARRVLRDADLPVSTVFFGGGTPTLLKPGELGAVLAAIAAEFGLAPDIEVTTEANPDSVALWDLEELRQVGFDRISFGMQSDVPHVLATLDRTHDPLRVPAVVGWARQAGFEQVSLDLIYGTPGESLADWETSLDAALACAPEHVSAYSLIVEEGTALARRIAVASSRHPMTTTWPTSTCSPTSGSPRQGWAGTRCPTGPATSVRAAGTTSGTGPAPTGGASARAPTRTSAAFGGGTSSTPRRTPNGSART